MILIAFSNVEKTRLIIDQKDRIKLKYKQRLNDIKQYYGIDFDLEHLSDENVKNITFYNLKYKNYFENLSVTYDNISNKVDYIRYEFSDSSFVKNVNHKKIIFNLDNEYKLKLLIAEINQANSNYRKELDDIDSNLSNFNNDIHSIEKNYQRSIIEEES